MLTSNGPIKIFILKNDFTVVGVVSESMHPNTGLLTNAAFIVNSGATLGYISLNGPKKETWVEFCGNIEIPTESVVMAISCNYGPWSEILDR